MYEIEEKKDEHLLGEDEKRERLSMNRTTGKYYARHQQQFDTWKPKYLPVP